MQNQLRIQIDNGEIQYLPDLGFHLMESPDILIPKQREYETERYPEHDGVGIYPYTTYEPFEYTCKLLFFGTLAEMNSAVRLLWESFFETVVHGGTRKAKTIRIFNDYKGVQVVGYAMAMPGEDTYIQTLGNGVDSNDSAWQCDLTIYVANPALCVWSSDIALLTYQLNGAIPDKVQQQVRIGSTIILPTPEMLGMWLPSGVIFSGWTMGSAPVEQITINGDITVVGSVDYNENAFYVLPMRLEVAYDNTLRNAINITCPDNTWTVSAADPLWATVIKISQNQAGVTLSQNNGESERTQIITFTWITPLGETITRNVDVVQMAYSEVYGEITGSIRVLGSNTGSGVQGLSVQLIIDGTAVASGITNAYGLWSGTWTQEQREWELVQNIQFAIAESEQYQSAIVTLSQKPTFSNAVANGINYGSLTVIQKTQYVQLIYSLVGATPSTVQRQVISGQQTILESPQSLGMILPNYMTFQGWTVNGQPQAIITPIANTNIAGSVVYNSNAFVVTPTLIEQDSNDATARTIHVACINNNWIVQAAATWATVTKIDQSTVSVIFSQNTGTTERSQNVTLSWSPPSGSIMTRTVQLIQLPYTEVIENIPLGIELRSSVTGTSFQGVDVEFYATIDGIEQKIASGITNNNGVWTGTWRMSNESYSNVSSARIIAGNNSEIIEPYERLWSNSAIPSFTQAKDGAYNIGATAVDPYGDSYITYTESAGGGRLRFSAANTPLSAFATSTTGSGSLTINGTPVVKNAIYGVYFGPSYDGTTVLPDNFLRGLGAMREMNLSATWRPSRLPLQFMMGCSSIESISLSKEWPIENIANAFRDCSAATNIVLPPEWQVSSIGSFFCYQCYALTSFTLPDTWPISSIGGSFMGRCLALTHLYLGNREWNDPIADSSSFEGMNSPSRTHHHATAQQGVDFEKKFLNTTQWMSDPIAGGVAILTDDTRIEFDITDTPLSNLSTAETDTGVVQIAGQSIVKKTIKEIIFGANYGATTAIPQNFLREFTSLTSVDLSIFTRVTSIGSYFIFYCTSMQNINLSSFESVDSIGEYFMAYCVALRSIQIGNVDAGSMSILTDGFISVINSSDRQLMANALQLIINFKNSFPNISAWAAIVN